MSLLPEVAPRVSLDIASAPTWIEARINMVERGPTTLSVYVSVLVEWTDEMFAPIIQRLGRHCVRLESKDSMVDPDMMFGEAIAYVFELLPFCPGSSIEHDCCKVDRATPRGEVFDRSQ